MESLNIVSKSAQLWHYAALLCSKSECLRFITKVRICQDLLAHKNNVVNPELTPLRV